jgi:disulfide oxidoreductase YuzD
MINGLLKERYGSQVTINYIDVDDDPEIDNNPEILKMLDEKSAALPIITIDGEFIFAGGISYPLIVAELTKRGITVNN